MFLYGFGFQQISNKSYIFKRNGDFINYFHHTNTYQKLAMLQTCFKFKLFYNNPKRQGGNFNETILLVLSSANFKTIFSSSSDF